jgi:hypothetical protein
MTNTAAFIEALKTSPDAFIQANGEANWRDGWKVSIQGRTLEDSRFLFDRLIDFMVNTKASFKFGTQKLIEANHPEQSTKLLTIYLPNGVDPKSYCELVRLNLIGYEGAKDIPEKRSYTKYSEGIFYRNDRTSEGAYIPA